MSLLSWKINAGEGGRKEGREGGKEGRLEGGRKGGRERTLGRL